jgi:hypothetical protein
VQADPAPLGAFIDQATRSLFRLETLDRYDVGSDGGDFQRYLHGEDGPDADRKAAWHKVLQADLDRGVTTSRVHVVCSPLSDYLRYEFEWGYAHNLAYEDIRILDLSEKPMPTGLDGIGDFWLIDDLQVAVMRYDGTGRYLGFEAAPDDEVVRYLAARDAAWQAGVPFGSYWASHRQDWRDSRHTGSQVA